MLLFNFAHLWNFLFNLFIISKGMKNTILCLKQIASDSNTNFTKFQKRWAYRIYFRRLASSFMLLERLVFGVILLRTKFSSIEGELLMFFWVQDRLKLLFWEPLPTKLKLDEETWKEAFMLLLVAHGVLGAGGVKEESLSERIENFGKICDLVFFSLLSSSFWTISQNPVSSGAILKSLRWALVTWIGVIQTFNQPYSRTSQSKHKNNTSSSAVSETMGLF